MNLKDMFDPKNKISLFKKYGKVWNLNIGKY